MSTATLPANHLIINNQDSSPYLKDNLPPINSLDLAKQLAKQDEEVKTTFRVAPHKGKVDSTVNKEWANRPDDEKYLSLTDMRAALQKRFTESRTHELPTSLLNLNRDMQLVLPDQAPVNLTNWTYNQLCALANAPVEYLKRLPNDISADCLRYGLYNRGAESIKALVNVESKQLRALNSATYGRIWDYQVLDEVMKIAGNGTTDTNWKIPGAIDWSSSDGTTVEYNPYVDVTKETTTLYASDRDMFLFLVDDTHPIEIGKLASGEPDLMFRGFYVSNSETGAGTFKLSCMMMRGVCANRNIWGVDNKQSMEFRHSAKAPDKFIQQAFPMLAAYAMSPTVGLVAKVRAAKDTIIASNEEEGLEFLTGPKVGLGKLTADAVLERVLLEEQKPMTSLWDAVQGITAYARRLQHQDARVDLETKAGKLMAKVSA